MLYRIDDMVARWRTFKYRIGMNDASLVPRHATSPRRSRRAAYVALLAGGILSVGCWQEIQYQPPEELAETPRQTDGPAASQPENENKNSAEPLDDLNPPDNFAAATSSDNASTTDDAPDAGNNGAFPGDITPTIDVGGQSEPLSSAVVDHSASPADAEEQLLGDDNSDPFAENGDSESVDSAARDAGTELPSESASDPFGSTQVDEDLAFLQSDDSPDVSRKIDPFAEGEVADASKVDLNPDLGFLHGPTPHERRAAWQAASRWSLAAAMLARGADEQSWQRVARGAQAAADEIALELPPLPAASEDRLAAVIDALSGEPGSESAQFSAAVERRIDAAEAASAQLAIRANLLLLTYTARSANAPQLAKSLQSVAHASTISPDSWRPLVTLLQERAEFELVKRAVFQLQREVAQSFNTDDRSGALGARLGG